MISRSIQLLEAEPGCRTVFHPVLRKLTAARVDPAGSFLEMLDLVDDAHKIVYPETLCPGCGEVMVKWHETTTTNTTAARRAEPISCNGECPRHCQGV